MKIGAIVLARSNFGRWPDKIKAKLGGLSIIERVIERLVKIKGFDEIILSTTDYPEDKWLMNLAGKYGVQFITGPPDDRGLRYYEAVMKYDLDYFYPQPANWPFIEIKLIEETIQAARMHPGHIYYRYMHVSSEGIFHSLLNRSVIEKYKEKGTDQELWWVERPEGERYFLYDWKDEALRNKYLISLNIAYPLEVALQQGVHPVDFRIKFFLCLAEKL